MKFIGNTDCKERKESQKNIAAWNREVEGYELEVNINKIKQWWLQKKVTR